MTDDPRFPIDDLTPLARACLEWIGALRGQVGLRQRKHPHAILIETLEALCPALALIVCLAWKGTIQSTKTMHLTIDLPPPLDDKLAQEAQREGVPTGEHATLLLYLATALLRDGEPTPFQEAVREFLAQHAVDADRVSTVFAELVKLCLTVSRGESEPALSSLTAWRNALVHRHSAPGSRTRDRAKQDTERSSAYGKYAGRIPTSEEFIREKQKEITLEDGLEE
jgi:hypothetical protein